MTVTDVDSIWSSATVIDPEDVAARTRPGRTGAGSQAQRFVESFNHRADPKLFLSADVLGERNVRQDGATTTAPHDFKSRQNLARDIRTYARDNGYEVNAEALELRDGTLGIEFRKEQPPEKSTRGPKRKDEAADEVE